MKSSSATLAAVMFLGAIALYAVVISPLSASLGKSRGMLTDELLRRSKMELTISQKNDYAIRNEKLARENAAQRTNWMAPMLNSYSMRAKSFLDDLARESGLVGVEYGEGGIRALPIPKTGLPKQRTGRRSVRIQANGDYAAIASFILRAEREQPLMTLQSLAITQDPRSTADRQHMELVVEWPCEGEEIK